MVLAYRDGIAVLQVMVYTPLFFMACFLWRRDGFGPGSAAWRFSSTFCSLRLTGAICSLAAISNKSETLLTAILISQVIGFPPLILSLVMSFDRINVRTQLVPKAVFIGIVVFTLVALTLGIFGANKLLEHGDTDVKPNVYMKAAMGTFIVLFAILLAFIALFASKWNTYTLATDRRVIIATSLATVFLSVKFLYTAIGDFGNSSLFAIVGGDTTVYFLMNVVMEMATASINIGFGLTYGEPVKPKKDDESDFELTEMFT